MSDASKWVVRWEIDCPVSGRKSEACAPCGDWSFTEEEARSFAWSMLAQGYKVEAKKVG